MRISNLISILCLARNIVLSILFLLVMRPSVLAQEDDSSAAATPDYSAELWEFTDTLEDSSGDIEEEKVSAAEEDEEVAAALSDLSGEKEEEAATAFDAQNSIFEGEGQTEKLRTNSNAFAKQKMGTRQYEGSLPGKAAQKMSTAYDDTVTSGAFEDSTLSFIESPVDEYYIDYEIDSIERLLDQKLDLVDGILTADVEALAINPEYGFNQESWDIQMAAVQAQIDQPALVKGETYWKYNSDPDREKMYTQEKQNMELLQNDVEEREATVTSMVENSAAIVETGGIEMDFTGLDGEVTTKLLDLDREILDIMTEDAYEKDLAANEDLLVHEITGLPLKGYAKRRALKELNGPYGQVEAMRTRNLEGDVLEENEILDLMMIIYDGYNPY